MENQNKTIAIAEDDPGILDMLTMLLEDENYKVMRAGDAKTIGQIGKRMPNLVLLDIWMSGIDGRDVCIKLKSQETTKSIPIVIMSANKDTEKIAKECGADDFISKPFDIDDMLRVVEKNIRQGPVS